MDPGSSVQGTPRWWRESAFGARYPSSVPYRLCGIGRLISLSLKASPCPEVGTVLLPHRDLEAETPHGPDPELAPHLHALGGSATRQQAAFPAASPLG